ncbi:hypothetical protein SAMN05216378_4031 [Paenibacillus catalpae]|uniref:N-acetyltransferase domain-containing protein n=1 Tax=Paenibacillus catalpae TaxID=1045775 RepID=A0A1I2DAA9_9BACL|nr:hypothetical protein [Paenibacillus catalpae]SFE77482.1 hypothetical protein SAMN05216378_4031 [Paenibacillus catalpae]
MPVRYSICQTDADLARYASFFIKNRTEFSKDYTLPVVLMHMLETLADAKIILIEDIDGQVIGWGKFEYRAPDTIFVDSVIIDKRLRSSRVFLDGFRYLVRYVHEQYPQVNQLSFRALSSQSYVNRLYSKFAIKTEEREGVFELESVYTAPLPNLLSYLGVK